MENLFFQLPATESRVSRSRILLVFSVVLVAGFLCFVAPNVFFQLSKLNGGFKGLNLLYTAAFQLLTVMGLIAWGLRKLKRDFHSIGLTAAHWRRDALLGACCGIGWVILQFAVLIPLTGGAARPDIQLELEAMDGTLTGLLSYLVLGIIGGGIAEEIYNRGFFITVLRDGFSNKHLGTYVAVVLSVLFFAAGHLPSSALEWVDILVPTLVYTFLFLYTGRLTASMVAHAVYNCLAVLCMYFLYYGSQ